MEYRRSNNPVLCFVEDECEIGSDYEVGKEELYDRYKSYAARSGYGIMHKENFFRELYAAVNSVALYRPRREGKRVPFLKGIRIQSVLT
jgi:putative DNA primase/helicase